MGPPYLQCPSCGGYVARPPFDEWAMMGPATRAGLLLNGGALFVALGLVPAVAYGLLVIASGGSSDLLALLVVAGAGLALSLGGWALRTSAVVRSSNRRMADPMYRARLIEFARASAAGEPARS